MATSPSSKTLHKVREMCNSHCLLCFLLDCLLFGAYADAQFAWMLCCTMNSSPWQVTLERKNGSSLGYWAHLHQWPNIGVSRLCEGQQVVTQKHRGASRRMHRYLEMYIIYCIGIEASPLVSSRHFKTSRAYALYIRIPAFKFGYVESSTRL